ncbi:hypothetical protein FNV43_RR01911 [Rhamnella rubrinervis]|uniref:Uncharacterized protein n=1 Tax=Rhamnella rubrinervis TaxID=2594499 RepID=A0A8K0HRV4_9ROSA|nr:hypothetical protein FNV43_RR01911 [Rhamnella rubrinervis]
MLKDPERGEDIPTGLDNAIEDCGGGNAREMDFDNFLDFVLALENEDAPEGYVHQKWIEGGDYELCIEDVRDEIWDMVKPADPLRITLGDLLACSLQTRRHCCKHAYRCAWFLGR